MGSEVGVKELASFRMNHTEKWTMNTIHVIGITPLYPKSSDKMAPKNGISKKSCNCDVDYYVEDDTEMVGLH